jgi:hypothetical protein
LEQGEFGAVAQLTNLAAAVASSQRSEHQRQLQRFGSDLGVLHNFAFAS